jgi:hypothetical protein
MESFIGSRSGGFSTLSSNPGQQRPSKHLCNRSRKQKKISLREREAARAVAIGRRQCDVTISREVARLQAAITRAFACTSSSQRPEGHDKAIRQRSRCSDGLETDLARETS